MEQQGEVEQVSASFTPLSESDMVHRDTITAFLNAYSTKVVRAALKARAIAEKNGRGEDGWKLWTGDGLPPKPYEYTMFNELWYYREPLSDGQRSQVAVAMQAKKKAETASKASASKICPDCGAEAFAQSVCPKCAKGKAGIRRQWVCGENSDHVFYTE